MWETWVRSLGWDDPLEEGMAAHSRVLPWEIPWTGEPGRLQAVGSQRVRHNLVIKQKQQYRILNLVQFSSVTQLCSTLWPHESQHARLPCPSSIPEVYPNPCPSSRWCHPAISSCHPLLLRPPIPPSIRVFSNESTLRMRWPKYWSFNFNISPSNEHPGLISFRMDSLDLPAVQGTLKSLLQHHSSKASILGRSAFFTVQLSHPYMTTGKP